MDFLNMDINIAYSIINMKLRDFYSSLDDLCEDMDINKSELLKHFEGNGFVYNQEKNQFISK